MQAWLASAEGGAPAEAAQPNTQAAAAKKPKKKPSQPIKPHKDSMLDPPQLIIGIIQDHLSANSELEQSVRTIIDGPIDMADVINRVQNEADCALALIGSVGNSL